jgi:sulfur-oxidizing protein SoxX
MRHRCPGLARAALALAAGIASLASNAQEVAAGRELFVRKDKGNCIACHAVPPDPAIASRATLGPPLSGVRERMPDRAALREMLFDPMRRNPATLMPPYGRHQILDAAEIERLIDYLHALR